MGHVTRDTSRCVIDIDTVSGQILLQQRWAYRWHVQSGLSPWTLNEKRRFHTRADRAVWAVWSNRARLSVSGGSDFARRHVRAGVPINLDIDWVLSGQHWTVNVTKVPAGQFYPSQVFWNQRQIQLGGHDYEAETRNVTGGTRRQRTVAHEFGHSAGNTGVLARGDEYPKPSRISAHEADDQSIMHVGEQLRERHFRTIIEELDQMIPDTRFRVRSLS